MNNKFEKFHILYIPKKKQQKQEWCILEKNLQNI